MKLYNYDPTSFCFVSSEDACVDPVESAKTGTTVYFISENSTEIKPPNTTENKVAQFDVTNKEWNLVSDYRGKTIFNKKNGLIKTLVSNVGEFSEEFTLVPFPGIHQSEYQWSDAESKWIRNENYEITQAFNKRDSLLRESDGKVLRYNRELALVAAGLLTKTTNTESEMLEWYLYQKKLCEYTDNWTKTKPFPEAPEIA